MKSIIDIHLSCTHYADTRTYRLGHCQIVSWLMNNFRKIKSEEVVYQDYVTYCQSNGNSYYNEESFDIFKNQEYI